VIWLPILVCAVLACERDPAPDMEAARPDTVEHVARPPVRDSILEAALREAAAGIEGEVGVAVLHLQRDVHASLNNDRRFALASVYKLPVAYAALQHGHVDPADSVSIASADRAPGDTPFAPGMTVPVARLVERSLAHSDNTASDVLLRLAGGPAEVSRRIHAVGAPDVRVDRSMRRIFAEWRGVSDLEGHEDWGLAELDTRAAAVPPRARQEAQAAFVADGRDSGTAEGMVTLLAALHRGEELRPAARQVLIEALHGAMTGPNRIRAGVPAGGTVAHKTGTLGPLTHDVGIITLPAGRGDVALAVLIQSDAPLSAREGVIAAMARAVWARFAEDADTPPDAAS
jgi:beta-lactamase class A